MRPRHYRSQESGSIEHSRPSPGGDMRPSSGGDEGGSDRTRVKRRAAEESSPLAPPQLKRARAECSTLLESGSSQEAASTAPNSSPSMEGDSPLVPSTLTWMAVEAGGRSGELEEGSAGRMRSLESATEGLEQGFELEVVAGGVRRRADEVEGEGGREASVPLEGGGRSSADTRFLPYGQKLKRK